MIAVKRSRANKVLKGLAWVFGGLLLAAVALISGFLLMLWLIAKYG